MNEKFLEYLDSLKELISLFETMQLSTEIMEQLPLTEEQIELVNAYLNELLSHWEDSFLIMLKRGVKWIEHNKKGVKKDEDS